MEQADWLDKVNEYAAWQARQHQSWQSVVWQVDDAAVGAAIWRFAGAWTGFTTALPDLYVIVTAVGVEPQAMRLSRLTDAGAYGFALGADITIGQMAIGAPLPNPNPRQFHPDHYAVRRRTAR
jgi:hypothetical protein